MNEIEILLTMHMTSYMFAMYEFAYGSTVLGVFILLMWELIVCYLLGGKPRF